MDEEQFDEPAQYEAYEWLQYNRAVAWSEYQHDYELIYEESEGKGPFPSLADYRYTPEFEQSFLNTVAGKEWNAPSGAPAVAGFLNKHYAGTLRRPDCQYFIDLLEAAYPTPGPREKAFIDWFEQHLQTLPAWPAEKVGGLFVGHGPLGPFNSDTHPDSPNSGKIPLSSTLAYSPKLSMRHIALIAHYNGTRPIENDSRGQALAAEYGYNSKNSGRKLSSIFKELSLGNGITGKEGRAVPEMIKSIELIKPFLNDLGLNRANTDLILLINKG